MNVHSDETTSISGDGNINGNENNHCEKGANCTVNNYYYDTSTTFKNTNLTSLKPVELSETSTFSMIFSLKSDLNNNEYITTQTQGIYFGIALNGSTVFANINSNAFLVNINLKD